MRWPIIVLAEDDILVFESPERVPWMEAVDVEEGVYEGAWDRDGRRLSLTTKKRPHKTLFGTREAETVAVEEIPDAHAHDPEFDDMILERLPAFGIPDPGDARGEALIQHILRHKQPT
jgi:hypothetical protein